MGKFSASPCRLPRANRKHTRQTCRIEPSRHVGLVQQTITRCTPKDSGILDRYQETHIAHMDVVGAWAVYADASGRSVQLCVE